MTQGSQVWINGKILPYEQAQVGILTHSLHYGSAAFEGIRAYKTTDGRTAVFRLREHIIRLFDSMRAMGYSSPFKLEDYMEATKQTIKANKLAECYIRPLAYIDDSVKGLKLPDQPKANSMIAVWEWGKYLGDAGQSAGIRAMVSSFRRADVANSLPWAKLSGNYLNSILARREAAKNGLDEAILLDANGFVAEGSGENIFVVKDGRLMTPYATSILPGITRASVMTIARDLGIEVVETNISRNELYLADETFFTGTAVEITPIREIDHLPIGEGRPGPITQKISKAFFQIVRGENLKYSEWLSYV